MYLFSSCHAKNNNVFAVSYEIVLPESLPPTHRGHSMRVAYRLVITTQHGAPDRPPRIAHVPFRVFNRVAGNIAVFYEIYGYS